MEYQNFKLPETKLGRKSKKQQIQYEIELSEFAEVLMQFQLDITEKRDWNRIEEKEKISARGWAYQLEGAPFHLISKDQFSYCEKLINDCRKIGYLPLNFVAQDKSREFYNIESLTKNFEEPIDYLIGYLDFIKDIDEKKEDIAFWESQKYYIQMTVEKIDVRNLFHDICKKYHIPISNAKGWNDINSRGELVTRFKKAEEIGLIPVLLYFADFDPAGLKIAENLRQNLLDIEKATHWNPKNLIINQFGLSFEFIKTNRITWIDNLITGGKRDLEELYKKYKAGTLGKKEKLYDYEIQYIETYGIQKCEANAIIPKRNIAIKDCEVTIQKYLGVNPFEVYDKKVKETQKEIADLMGKIDYKGRIQNLMDDIENSNQDSN